MILTGEPMAAAEARDQGLVARVVPDELVEEDALALAAQIATRPPVALRLAKEAVNAAYETSLTHGLAHERRLFYLLFASDDQKEGMAAFMEKRTPDFKGPMTLGNPDRPVGGLAVRAPSGVELRPMARDDLAVAVAMARELHGVEAAFDAASCGRDTTRCSRQRRDAIRGGAETARRLGSASCAFPPPAELHHLRGLDLGALRPAPRRRAGDRPRAAGCAGGRVEAARRPSACSLQVPEQASAAEALLSRAGFEAWMLDFVQRPVRPEVADVPAGRHAATGDWVAMAAGDRPALSEFGAPRTPAPERMEAVLRTYDEHLRRVEAGEARTIGGGAGRRDGRVCSLEWRGPFWTAETHARLPDLIVTEAARGRGIGRALLADAVAAAAAHGAAQPFLESGRTRTAAHGLYRSRRSPKRGRPIDCCARTDERLPATPADRAARVDCATDRQRPVAVRRRSRDHGAGGAAHSGAAAWRGGRRGLLERRRTPGFDVWQDEHWAWASPPSHRACRSLPS